jgi:uncharacterized protein YndB with AHSA1/START domain
MWRFIMHGPDGTDYRDRIVYEEVVPPERLVYQLSEDVENDPGAIRVTVTFAQQGEGTLLTMRSLFKTAAQREFVVKEHNAIEGGRQTLARLAEFVARGLGKG